MCRLHHQDERWQLQSHDMRRLRLRVLLAVHEGNIRPALPEVSSCTEAAKPKCSFIFWQLFLFVSLLFSPSGCTFWGKKPWSRKKKILWQLGTLVGAPVGIALIAGIAIPAMIIGIPVYVGRKVRFLDTFQLLYSGGQVIWQKKKVTLLTELSWEHCYCFYYFYSRLF